MSTPSLEVLVVEMRQMRESQERIEKRFDEFMPRAEAERRFATNEKNIDKHETFKDRVLLAIAGTWLAGVVVAKKSFLG